MSKASHPPPLHSMLLEPLRKDSVLDQLACHSDNPTWLKTLRVYNLHPFKKKENGLFSDWLTYELMGFSRFNRVDGCCLFLQRKKYYKKYQTFPLIQVFLFSVLKMFNIKSQSGAKRRRHPNPVFPSVLLQPVTALLWTHRTFKRSPSPKTVSMSFRERCLMEATV